MAIDIAGAILRTFGPAAWGERPLETFSYGAVSRVLNDPRGRRSRPEIAARFESIDAPRNPRIPYAHVASGSNITAGEELGYVDFDVPLGPPNPDYVYGGVLGSVIASVAGTYLPANGTGRVAVVPDEEGPFPGAPVSDRPSFPEGSIYGPGGTWGENPLPPGIYDIPPEDTRPNELPPPPIPEEGGPATRDAEGDVDMATDWGDFISQTTQDFITGFVGGGSTPAPTVGVGGVAPPARVTVDTRTGAVTPCKRRRRRRLLTSSDLNDLAALKTIVGGGQALNGAVIKAVRR